MSDEKQQQQQKLPQDNVPATRSSPRRDKSGPVTMSAKQTTAAPLPPPPASKAAAVARPLFAQQPAGGTTPHGFAQHNQGAMQKVPNPLAPPPAPNTSNKPPPAAAAAAKKFPPPGASLIHSITLPGPLPYPPVPESDPKEMEERQRKALAYAMRDDITGGAKGRKRHAAKLAAAEKKAAAAASKAKAALPAHLQHLATYAAQHAPSAALGTTSTAAIPGRTAATTTVANPLARPAQPQPAPAGAAPATATTTATNTGVVGRPRKPQATFNPKQQQLFNPNAALEMPRKERQKKTPGVTKKPNVDKLPISLLAEAASNSPSAAVPDAFAPLPLRRSYDDESLYDPEYARFMRSIMGDDQSVMTFKTLQSVKSQGPSAPAAGPPLGTVVGDGSMIGSAFGTMDEDDASYQLTSDEDDDDDDDGDDDEMEEDGNDNNDKDGQETKEEETHSPAKGTRGKRKAAEAFRVGSPPGTKPLSVDKDDLGVFQEIEGLMEEDLEAAVASLIGVSPEGEFSSSSWHTGAAPPTGKNAAMAGTEQAQAITTPGQSTKKQKSTATIVTSPAPVMLFDQSGSNHAPSARREPPTVSQEQFRRLRTAMARHHQLLLQQATLSVRAAYVQKTDKDGKHTGYDRYMMMKNMAFVPPNQNVCTYQNDFFGGESPEELSDCLDHAVSMLQDLEQHWKDAVRNSLLQSFGATRAPPSALRDIVTSNVSANNSNETEGNKRLTRSAFTKTLIAREIEAEPVSGEIRAPTRQRVSVFEVRGLARLRETFTAIDTSVKDIYITRDKSKRTKDSVNILNPCSHGNACNILLNHAKAEVDPNYVPGQFELYHSLTHAPEVFSDLGLDPIKMKVKAPLTKEYKLQLRKSRNQFTAGEDNLILRGVNLYGEKEWVLVSDRFLPDRPVNQIAQRYNRLCFLIYKASGISIGDKGELPPLPKLSKNGTYNEEKANEIPPAAAPTTMNVHRWTLEEDLAILRAVPIMGNSWADISSKFMPHRDRGHIRKRYQVLERRIPKGVCRVNLRRMLNQRVDRSPSAKPPKKVKTSPANSVSSQKKPKTSQSTAAKAKAPDVQPFAARPTIEPPMTPVKSSVQSSGPYSHGVHGFGNAAECHSPETKSAAAALLGGFSQESQACEDTRMGVLKILEIADGKLADSNFGEGSFGKGGAPRSPMKSSRDLLDDRQPEVGGGGRTSILDSVMDNVRKKDNQGSFPGTTPSKVDAHAFSTTTSHVATKPEPDEPSPTMFTLGTPSKEAGKGGSSMDGEDFARMFSQRDTPLKTGLESPAKTGSGSNFSPIKLGNLAPPTPITHLGSLGLSGPIEGMNSLFMGASDLDAVAALKDLSNSNPGTPANIQPRENAREEAPERAAAAEEDEAANERKSKRPKTSFFGQVQANVDKKRKSG